MTDLNQAAKLVNDVEETLADLRTFREKLREQIEVSDRQIAKFEQVYKKLKPPVDAHSKDDEQKFAIKPPPIKKVAAKKPTKTKVVSDKPSESIEERVLELLVGVASRVRMRSFSINLKNMVSKLNQEASGIHAAMNSLEGAGEIEIRKFVQADWEYFIHLPEKA